MMRIALKVKYSDGREQAVMVSAPDLIAFEREFDKPTTVIGTGRLEYLWWVTWHASKRLAFTTLGFDEWMLGIDNIVDDVEAGGEPAPLVSSQPTG